MDKVGFRQRMLQSIRLSEPWKDNDAVERLHKNVLLVLSRFPDHQFWGGFQPLRTEPPAVAAFTQSNKLFCYPKIAGLELHFFQATEFEKNQLGVLEPVNGKRVESNQLTGLFIPGLAFGDEGQRLGRGRGYYDRFLFGYTGLKVGLCSSLQRVKDIPEEKQDIRMDVVVTEQSVHWIKGRSWN